MRVRRRVSSVVGFLLLASVVPSAGHAEGWTVVESPDPGASYNSLRRVDCASATDCWAVGWYWAGKRDQALIEHYDGTGWSHVPSPVAPGDRGTVLVGIDCLGDGTCWAVGNVVLASAADVSFGNATLATQPIAERYDGSSWSIVPTAPAPGIASLSGVSCVAADDCWAVGSFGAGVYNTLVEHWDGIAWSIVPSPNPSPATNVLFDVTCQNTDDCWAVGQFFSTTPASCPKGSTVSTETLVEHYDGVSWTVADSAFDPCYYHALESIDCPVFGECATVGTKGTETSTQSTLVKRLNGGSWPTVETPNTSPTRLNHLSGIDCVGAGDCVAVGTQDIGGPYRPLVLREVAGSWSIVETPLADTQWLFDVACPSSSGCWAVGVDSLGRTLIEHGALT